MHGENKFITRVVPDILRLLIGLIDCLYRVDWFDEWKYREKPAMSNVSISDFQCSMAEVCALPSATKFDGCESGHHIQEKG